MSMIVVRYIIFKCILRLWIYHLVPLMFTTNYNIHWFEKIYVVCLNEIKCCLMYMYINFEESIQMYSVKANLEVWVTGNLSKCLMQKTALTRSKIMCRSSSQYKTTLKLKTVNAFHRTMYVITKYKCVSVSTKYVSDLTRHSQNWYTPYDVNIINPQ